MSAKEILKLIFKIFTIVTTGIVIAAMLSVTVIDKTDSIDPAILWQILAVSAACSLSALVCFGINYGKSSTVSLFIRPIIHYLIINAIVLGASYLFGWFGFDSFLNVLPLILMIAVIYAIVFICVSVIPQRESKKINEKLKSIYSEKNDGNK